MIIIIIPYNIIVFNDMANHCQHNYCPHLHFKKCQTERQRKIPYTTRPTKEIQLSCNVHPKMLNLSIRNIPTLAYEQYSIRKALPAQDQMNFSKNYYLENCPQNFQLRNTLVNDTKEEMQESNAYVLAIGATKQYNTFAKQRLDHLVNAQKRAKISYHNYFQLKKEKMMLAKQQQRKWVIDYCRKVEELIDHMFSRKNQNVDPNLHDKLFIKQNQGKNTKYLSAVKVADPKVALQILQALRAVLLKKKLSLQEQRKNQDHNKSVSASCIDSSASQDVTQGTSFMSAATNDASKSPAGEEHFAEQFCDFQSIKKRWGVKDVTQIRNIIRRLVAKVMVTNAQGYQMRQKKAAKQKNQLLMKQMAQMGYKMPQSKGKGKGKDTNKSSTKKGTTKQKIKSKQEVGGKETQQTVALFKDSLNNEQESIKRNILKGGQFDSVGDKYQRNRNYSLLFKKKQQQSQFQISFREQNQFYRPQTTRK